VGGRHSGKGRAGTGSEVGTLVQKMELEHHAEDQHREAESIQCSLESLEMQIGRCQNPYESGGPSEGLQNHRGLRRHRHGLHGRHGCQY
jgi:hypothetical protein